MAPFTVSAREQRALEQAAHFYRRQENHWLPRTDRIYVCSTRDRDRLRQRGFEPVSILPNTVSIVDPPPLPEYDNPFTFLFIGNLNHFPNLDALRHLVGDLLPSIRHTAAWSFKILVVGSGRRSAKPPAFARVAELEWVGKVDDLTAVYRQAHASLVPLRCGGGTRIKILESFAMGRPVISTPAGAQGLEVRDGKDLLIAKNPGAFGLACTNLMRSPSLRSRLAARGIDWVRANASPTQLQTPLRPSLAA
jgi:glycosyltransferase involved in cell wall biosynthesis